MDLKTAKLKEEVTVSFTVNGIALTKKAYNLKLEEAKQQIASGDYGTQENLEKEIEKW